MMSCSMIELKPNAVKEVAWGLATRYKGEIVVVDDGGRALSEGDKLAQAAFTGRKLDGDGKLVLERHKAGCSGANGLVKLQVCYPSPWVGMSLVDPSSRKILDAQATSLPF
ncbi:hypothetical protein LR48_Vigan05g090200 [Vigna angularis]|uniref:Uncharacterized protein n=1 Tax=Phaseolus angularis TaxID=3914 RepID=A0A0L9UKL0_PHAAN|nr:hypothetical protein LR48_Vigan05g090200 [Vigna angularis]